LDFTIDPGEKSEVWNLADLFGRPIATIKKAADKHFVIAPAQRARFLSNINPGPYTTLDEALSAVEKRMRGVGRHA
jgi:hypothetical protein